MKKLNLILFTFLTSLLLMSCNIKNLLGINSKLYNITDEFVESLQTTYQSYGVFGGFEYTKYTPDSSYRVMPVGRLINVRIENSVDASEYESLMNDLKDHYKGNTNVNDVYICNGGTIMIDCRN